MTKFLLASLGVLAGMTAAAAPLTPEQALDRLDRNGQKGNALKASGLVYTAKTPGGTNCAYVFANPEGAGFRVLSADDTAYPVLGYSDSGVFDAGNPAPGFIYWMDYLGAQIDYAVSHGATAADVRPAAVNGAAVGPLVTTKWDQDDPYYNMAPVIRGARCYTGCVATSMAQVMNYHKYPEIGEGSNSYTWNGGTMSMNFGETAFDWANMLDVYQRGAYSQQQGDAVAYLMKACGYSLNMNYGTSASGTQGAIIADALKNYFKYDKNLSVKYRTVYSASEWAQMVCDNLRDCGPLVLNGHPYQSSGHSFVCDGYDGKGYFHINWGWSGISDGWFLMEALNPDAQGIGGAAGGGGFNYSLNGIFGIQKPTGKPVEQTYDNMLQAAPVTGELTGSNLMFVQQTWYPQGWYNPTGHDIRVNMGVRIEPVDGTPGTTEDKPGRFSNSVTVKMTTGVYFNTLYGPVVTLPQLADGRYKATIVVRDLNNSGPYIPILCPYGMPNYVYLNVAGGNVAVENVAVPELSSQNLVCETTLVANKKARYKVTLRNDSEYELTETLAPALMQGDQIKLIGYGQPSTVAARSTAELAWVAGMSPVQGESYPSSDTEYTLAVVNPVTMKVLGKYGNVTVVPSQKNATLSLSSFVMDNCSMIDIETDNGTVKAYDIPDGADAKATLEYYVRQGYFDGVLTAGIYTRNPENYFDIMPVRTDVWSEQPFLGTGEEATEAIDVDLTGLEPKTVYLLMVRYTVNSTQTALASLSFIFGTSGVELQQADTAAAKYYNLQGMEVRNPVRGEVYILKQGEKTTKVVF